MKPQLWVCGLRLGVVILSMGYMSLVPLYSPPGYERAPRSCRVPLTRNTFSFALQYTVNYRQSFVVAVCAQYGCKRHSSKNHSFQSKWNGGRILLQVPTLCLCQSGRSQGCCEDTKLPNSRDELFQILHGLSALHPRSAHRTQRAI